MGKYVDSLKRDLLEQYKSRENIESLMEVIGQELEEVGKFLDDLNVKRDVYTAEGAQLDGVGNIVGISRRDAAILADVPVSEMVDDDYRTYIIYKILKNTCECTYASLMKAIYMFWHGESPVKYSEDPDYPATIILDIEGFSETGSLYDLLKIPLIRAAGVGLRIQTTSEMDNGIYIGIVQNSEIEGTWRSEPYDLPIMYTDEISTVLTTEDSAILIE